MRHSHRALLLTPLAGALFLTALLPHEAIAAPRPKKQGTAPPPPDEKTQIRSGAPVFLITQSSKRMELTHLNVEVKNVGRTAAKGIAIFAEVGSGLMTQLRGASTLAAGQSGMYLLRSRMPLVQHGPVRIITSCANCRR